MYLKENMINIVKRVKRMTDSLGHSANFATLSLSLSLSLSQVLTYNTYTLLRSAGTRVNIRFFLHPCKGGRIVFLSRN